VSDLGNEPDLGAQPCPSCSSGDHSHHVASLAGICIGCSCTWRPEPEEDEYGGADDDGDLTVEDTEDKPSTELTLEELDGAMLLLVVDVEGKSRMWTDPMVDPGQLAKGLRRTAKALEASRVRRVETVRTLLDPT
jgi:hypothetical protein